MKSEIITYHYKNKEIQRVQKVILDSIDDIEIAKPIYSKKAFDALCDLYRDYIIKRYHLIFDKVILFALPDDIEIPFDSYDPRYGNIKEPLAIVSIAFKKNIRVKKGKLEFKDDRVKAFYDLLKGKGYLYCAQGDLNGVTILPVSGNFGLMSESHEDALLKVNSSFFVMDKFDCATVYDHIGCGIGLEAKDGIIYNPPLFDRETLFIDKRNKATIGRSSLKEIGIIIDGKCYKDGLNCTIYSRPEHKYSKKDGFDIIILDNKIIALNKGGSIVPGGGFILHLEHSLEIKDLNVTYKGYENMKLAIQVGNSAVIDHKVSDHFKSSFYDIKQFWKWSYPPSLYPLNFNKDRAPRIILGTDEKDQIMLLWFEGAAKSGHKDESRGASLKEANEIAAKLGMVNGIHLDGGGSAEILIENRRILLLSDRDPVTFEEKERGISFELIVKK